MKKLRINEIFYSLQGEGYHTGRAAVFIRLSGCNLKCPFCDTDFSQYTEMTCEQIVDEVNCIGRGSGFVVITGGEPTIQGCIRLIDELQKNHYEVAMESNGTNPAPYNLNWLTISPKNLFVDGSMAKPKVTHCDELKIVFDGEHEISVPDIKARHYYLQPCDTGDPAKNERIIKECVEFIKQHPKWKLSLQTQKILKVR